MRYTPQIFGLGFLLLAAATAPTAGAFAKPPSITRPRPHPIPTRLGNVEEIPPAGSAAPDPPARPWQKEEPPDDPPDDPPPSAPEPPSRPSPPSDPEPPDDEKR